MSTELTPLLTAANAFGWLSGTACPRGGVSSAHRPGRPNEPLAAIGDGPLHRLAADDRGPVSGKAFVVAVAPCVVAAQVFGAHQRGCDVEKRSGRCTSILDSHSQIAIGCQK
jgi:hypothetical protein